MRDPWLLQVHANRSAFRALIEGQPDLARRRPVPADSPGDSGRTGAYLGRWRDFIVGLVAKGMGRGAIFLHLLKNIAPTTLAVCGVQMGYLMAGSILVETVFSWPGTGLLLNTAILQRDIPLLQGTIFVLAMFFVGLNLLVDMVQPLFDPRMKRT